MFGTLCLVSRNNPRNASSKSGAAAIRRASAFDRSSVSAGKTAHIGSSSAE
jgi:hypothetical protein